MALREFVDLGPANLALAQAAERQVDPLTALIQGFQLPQQIKQEALNQQLSTAINQAKLQELKRGKIFTAGGGIFQEDPITGGVKTLIPPSSTTGPETYSTVVTDQGIFRVGNRSTSGVPFTAAGSPLGAPQKQLNVRQFSDAQGNLFEQPLTGGTSTPVLNPEGKQINIGVANRVLTSDQGMVSVPTKTEGGAAPTTTPLSAGGTILTRTKTSGATGAQTEASKQFLNELSQTAITNLDDLDSRVSALTVGPASLTKVIPGSPAADFSADLRSLTSDIRLGVLTQMKALSKTGASGLGQVSNQEGKSLESALGSLEQEQSPTNIKKNLKRVRESVSKWNQAVSQADLSAPEAPKKKDSLGLFD